MQRTISYCLSAALLSLGLLFSTGCTKTTGTSSTSSAAKKRKAKNDPRLQINIAIIKDARGNKVVSFNSEPGIIYNVRYQHKFDRNRVWKTLPAGDSIRGTGKTITVVDKLPTRENHRYRVEPFRPK